MLTTFPEGTSWTLTPLGMRPATSSCLKLGTTMQDPPCFQSTGVATFLVAVSWRLSTTRMISSKLRPVVAGYSRDSFSLLLGPITNTALQYNHYNVISTNITMSSLQTIQCHLYKQYNVISTNITMSSLQTIQCHLYKHYNVSSTNITMQCQLYVKTLQCIAISLYKLNKMRFPSYLSVKAIIPLASFSSGSIMPYSSATFLLGSAMMG